MTKVRIVARADTGPRWATVVPLPQGQPPPDPDAAAAAGFTGAAGEVVQVAGWWLVAVGDDPAASGALAAARMQAADAQVQRPGTDCAAIHVDALDPATASSFAVGFATRAWRFDRLRASAMLPHLQRLDLVTGDPAGLHRAWDHAGAALEGAGFARDLVAEPSNTLTPQGFIKRLRSLTKVGVEVEVIDRRALHRLGLGGLLAVGAGSAHPPALVILRWRGDGRATGPLVFVGKGITFDTGGICIKPAAGMEEMRADMAGAAACAGAMLALARRRSPAPVTAVLALAENATGGASYRPGDVLRLYDGSTVEVVDTDAEGRLVLADALGWAVRCLAPVAMVDLATLTGSVVVALGGLMAGVFGNDDALRDKLRVAGDAVGEPVWPMPIGQTHVDDLRSEIADVRHCVPGRGQPDACHAAAFLRGFVGDTPWAHLDIAGMEQRAEADDRYAAGASGFGVRLLNQLVADSFE